LKYLKILLLWPTNTRERMTIFAEAYGIKMRCYWEHTGDHVGSMDQHNWTYCELIENLMGTKWEHIGNKRKMKYSSSTPHPKKKSWSPWSASCTFSLVHVIFIFKYVGHFFFYSTNSPFYKHGCILWALIKLYSFKLEL
jgi:hypothetical protein